MKLMISGGGTGGHVYPALAVVQALKSDTDILWVGSKNGMEKRLITEAGLPFKGITAGALRGKNPLVMLKGLLGMNIGFVQSHQILRQFKPDVLLVTGGYVCVPMSLAANNSRIPIVVYLPDVEPGEAIKFLSKFATKVAVTTPETPKFFEDNLAQVTGYPVRKALYNLSTKAAIERLNLDPNRRTLLVFGGSQGARSINQAITEQATLQTLLAKFQVIHISGTLDAEWTAEISAKLPVEQQAHYRLYPYLDDLMPAALVAADLVICRAGASTLGELPAAALPAILVPYPHSGAHQYANANYLADRGAATIVDDSALKTELLSVIMKTLTDDTKLDEMRTAMAQLDVPDAAENIVELLQTLGS